MYSYRVKVKKAGTYLWGGTAMKYDVKSSIYLHLRVDETGEQIALERRDETESGLKLLGIMDPGESVTIALRGLTGVSARCSTAEDCFVDCAILVGQE